MDDTTTRRPHSPLPPAPPSTPAPPLTPRTHPFPGHALSPMSGLHTILGKKANRSSSLSQVVNSFDSSPSLSDASLTLLDSPFRKAECTPKQRPSFYNPRESSDSESDSDDDDFARDESPELHEGDNRSRARSRSARSYIAPKRWPERLKGGDSSGASSGMGTAASNSSTSLAEIPPGSMGRQSSPEVMSMNIVRGSMSDIGSEDLPLRKLSVSRDTLDNRTLSPFPKSLQRIAQTLAEESAPSEADMRREGMLYRYLRDYTPNSPMHSPLDVIPYELDADDEIIDSQSWWPDQSQQGYNGTKENTPRRESSPSTDAMETSNPPTRGQSVPPISIPEPFATRRLSSTAASLNGDTLYLSPTNVPSMPPPMIPQLARMKRKAEYGLDSASAIKRRNISPGSSPLLSPIAMTSGRERRLLNLQDTHNGLEKMSLQD